LTSGNQLITPLGKREQPSKPPALRAGLQQFVAQGQLEDAVKEIKPEPRKKPGNLSDGRDKIYVGKGQYIQV
jgi:hypothetical protein